MATAKKKSSKSKTAVKKPAARKTSPAKKSSKAAVGKTAVSKAVTKAPAKKVPAKKVASAATSKAAATKRPASAKSPLVKVIEKALEDMKAVNITVLDVRGLTDVADTMIIASGTSDRHVKSVAERVAYEAKQAGFRAMGVEGERDGEWALVDLNDVIVHVMLPRVREFYRLESLWDISAARREAAQ
jgi:ribosome-associated protein